MDNQSLLTSNSSRDGERGAALVMVLLISSLMLVAVTGLLLESSMHGGNVTDATAEEQAYYAAESGIQSVVNVLRQNTVLPDSLRMDTSKPATDPANKIDYFKAVTVSKSNLTSPADCTVTPRPLDCTARLSRWMNYDTNFPDRVILGDNSSTYNQQTGFAYQVEVEDPDNLEKVISYTTSIRWDGSVTNTRTWLGATLGDTASITYEPYSGPTQIDVSSGSAATNFGRFRFFPAATGAGVTSFTRTRFTITINMTKPYTATKVIRGHIESGSITGSSTSIWILFDSPVYNVAGTSITLEGGTDYQDSSPLPPPDGYYRVGYRVIPNGPLSTGTGESAAGVTTVKGTITAPQPLRLLIRSTGFGPMGARKQLEAIIQKNYFNGLGAPSPLTLIGPACTPVLTCTPPAPTSTWAAPNFVFNPGTSSGTVYNGRDVSLRAFLPPIGVTNDANHAEIRYGLTHDPPNKYNGSIWGNVENVAEELPFWLQSPKNLHDTLMQLKEVAKASGKYYGPSVTPPSPGGGRYGDPATATGITYIDGPLEFSQEGGGIIVVTGGLTFKGGFTFNGLVIVTGTAGISRTGGGSGSLQGNVIVAPYTDPNLTTLNGFLAPRYDISGGGGSEIVYNSNNVTAGLGSLTNFVKGVAEK